MKEKIADTIEFIMVAIIAIVGIIFGIGYMSVGNDGMSMMVLIVTLVILIQIGKEFFREYWG